MLVVETIAKIGRAHFIQDKSIKQICREFRVLRNTVRKVLRSGATEFRYDECKRFFGTIGHVIRCGRVSGLEDAACQASRVCMEICRSGPVRLSALDCASWGMMVLPIRSHDRLPLRSSVLLTSSATPRRPRPMRPKSPVLCNPRPCTSAPRLFGPCGWPVPP